MAKRTVLWAIFTALTLITALPREAVSADDPNARAIMEKVDGRDDGDDATMDQEMILIDRIGKQRIRKIKTFVKDFGNDSFRIMFFVEPADMRGTAFLTYDHDGDLDDDQWLYLPALKRTKRIASREKSQSFMGSDFSFADLTKPEIEKYEYRLLKEKEVNGYKTWLIEAKPNSIKVVSEYGYTKSLLFVRQENFVVVRAVHWVEGGDFLKYMDVKRLELIDDIWVPTEIHMTKRRGKITEHKSIMRLYNVRFNQILNKNLFTVRQLEKGL